MQRLRANDGVSLAVEHFGAGDAPTLLFAHGFGQTRHAWSETASALALEDWHCVIADGRGHGDSGWREDGDYNLDQFVDDLALLAQQSVQLPILIGASMGGLLGLLAEAEYGPRFRALILVDITPRWETAGVERILVFMRAHPQGFDSIEQAADAIAHYLPHRSGRKSPERLRQLLITGEDRRLRWHWDPRLVDRVAADSGRYQARLLDAASRIRVPILLISGASSDVVSAATIHEFLTCAPHAQHVRVAQATHMVVGDRNDAFTAAVKEFIQPLRHADHESRNKP